LTPYQPHRVWIATAAVGAAFLSSCDFDGVTEVDRPRVARADVTLTFTADSLPEAAERLGWGSAIPGAEVALARDGASPEDILTATTDIQGTVRFEDVAVGRYQVSLSRPFTAEEFEEVRDTGATGAADVFTRSILGPTAEIEIAPPPMLRRDLVISEYHFNYFFRSGIGTYATGGFLELYNNSDTIIYLDGKLVGRTFDPVHDATPCDWTTAFRTDPVGVWGQEIQRFPGSGRDFPLEPGQVAVIATDAIDHSEFIDELLDLSGADFEFSGPAGPDNPGVPNMIDVAEFTNQLGHGIIYNSLVGIPFVADAVDLDTVERVRFRDRSYHLLRIPRDRVLDVAAFYTTFPGLTWCFPFVHRDFNRREAPYIPDGEGSWLTSINRKVALVLPDGRKVLQHTRNSETDFSVGERTPGWIP
jgi:hypothetical protein